MVWRYDPILINESITPEYHLRSFEELCSQLNGYTNICTISFVDLYHKLSKTVKDNVIKEIPEEQMHHLAAELSGIAAKHGIELRACCEKNDFSADGVKPAACIDKELVEHICGHALSIGKDKNQRPGCGCIQSVDIGVYNTCKNGCVYCYANHSAASIDKNYQKHNPYSEILIGEVDGYEKITDRK
jgi:hypothetical protein